MELGKPKLLLLCWFVGENLDGAIEEPIGGLGLVDRNVRHGRAKIHGIGSDHPIDSNLSRSRHFSHCYVRAVLPCHPHPYFHDMYISRAFDLVTHTHRDAHTLQPRSIRRYNTSTRRRSTLGLGVDGADRIRAGSGCRFVGMLCRCHRARPERESSPVLTGCRCGGVHCGACWLDGCQEPAPPPIVQTIFVVW